MHLSRRASWFLLAFGGWSWFVWITFVRNLWKDSSGLAFEDGDPTGYFWVHLVLAVTSFALGTAIGWLGLRGVRAARRAGGGADGGVAGEGAGGDVREAAGAGR
ncbi:SCO4848 family membrane protein [Streptomyces synnematoformans]|uniref:Integral membrane protein n=1 Tax=Streptomyces synnematoformans TaxID=415721 RepID=A0ABN2ZC22_9ACTN